MSKTHALQSCSSIPGGDRREIQHGNGHWTLCCSALRLEREARAEATQVWGEVSEGTQHTLLPPTSHPHPSPARLTPLSGPPHTPLLPTSVSLSHLSHTPLPPMSHTSPARIALLTLVFMASDSRSSAEQAPTRIKRATRLFNGGKHHPEWRPGRLMSTTPRRTQGGRAEAPGRLRKVCKATWMAISRGPASQTRACLGVPATQGTPVTLDLSLVLCSWRYTRQVL